MTGKLIGLVGYKGAGKTTLTATAILDPRKSLMALPIWQMSFSTPIVDMLSAMGIPEQLLADKSKWNDPLNILCGHSIRYAATTLGTEWGRDQIGDHLWTNIALAQTDKANAQDNNALIDNVRFPSEFQAMKERGAIMIAVTRPNLVVDLSHQSERHIAGLQRKCDHRIENLDGAFNECATVLRILLQSIIE